MVVLAVETVTPRGSVGVWRDGALSVVVGEGAPHAGWLPIAWMDALAHAGLGLDDVDRVAVVSGPGSFTGVRIGMASVQGLALTRGWSVAAVPSLDSMAECWRAAHEGQAPRTVIACLDGMRGEVFTRVFQFDGSRMTSGAEPLVGAPALVLLPASGPVSLVGSGATRFAETWASRSDDIGDVTEPLAAGAVRLAAQADWPLVAPYALRPIYVRRPDVELARERGQPGVG
jgi:tRNA threonylcarbamoyladenosine biosynthesis protein TsaB